MRAPKIFISHSTKQDAENHAFLETLCAALKADDQLEVLVDLDLQAGDKWHAKINEWMHECDAAIILLNEKALKSDWVTAESTFVAVRDRNEAPFKLVPVLLPGITAEKITEHPRLGSGSAAHLDESQFISHPGNNDNCIKEIKTALARLAALSTPFDEIARIISEILQEASPQSLKAACESLNLTVNSGLNEDAEKYADALTRYLFRQQCNCLESFKEILSNIRPKLNQRPKEFYQYIRSLWVNSGAAACLPATASKPQPYKMPALNGKNLSFTLERYAERAWPLKMEEIETIHITNSLDFEEIQGQMRDHFQPDNPTVERLTPEECDDDIRYSDPILVCIPTSRGEGEFIDPGTRQQLTEYYSNVIFVFATGEVLPADTTLPEGIFGIRPELDIDIENNQHATERRVERFLARYCS